MNRLSVGLVLSLIGALGCASPQYDREVATLSPAVSVDDLKAEVGFLASDECAGRLTGSDGARRAGEYIAAGYRRAGLKPLPGMQDYFQPFEFTGGVRLVKDQNSLELLSSGTQPAQSWGLNEDYAPLGFSANGLAEGDVAFAGYGLVEPSADQGYNSYSDLDVSGKIVLALRDVPEDVSAQRRQELSLYAGSRYKAKLAADRGAKGFLLVVGPNSPHGGELVKLRPNDRTSAVTIPAASITAEVADRLLAPTGKTLKQLQTTLDGGERTPPVKAMSPARVRLNTALDRVRKTCRNVLGYLPPTGGADEFVLVGAHYDHIGDGVGLGSLAKQGEEGKVHNGADDNASGTSVVLELAGAVADGRRKEGAAKGRRGVIFACWSGEELGLIGSSHFANHPPIPLDKMAAYFNFDMVGRLRDDKLILQAVGSSPAWRPLIAEHDDPAGFELVLQNDPYLPTDATVFYTKGIPAVSFFTDLHPDYNRPSDDPATLNYEGMQRVARFAERLIAAAAEPELAIAYVKIQQSAPRGTGMGRRTYTGVVPDFAGADTAGVLLSDVRAGSPAEQAGLRGGDIIVGFAGQKIANLRDYSDALTGAKIGETVEIIVQRDGEKLTMTITPAVRN